MSQSVQKQSVTEIEETERDRLNDVAARYTVRLTPHIVQSIRPGATNDPVARQYQPDVRELETTPAEHVDPIGDHTHSPVKGIVHRYPDRALLMPVEICAAYCRFCFRRERVGHNENAILPDADLDTALDYIRAAPGIREVILSGGDPLVLSPRRLKTILGALDEIAHVKSLRIHTRLPLVDPDRINEALTAVIESLQKPVYIVIHVNHRQELTPAVRLGLKRLRRAGAILLSQSVLLKDVNDSARALEDLFCALVENGVKPYYLHHPDLAPGTAHFRVPVATGQAIMQSLRGRVSGLALPTYVLDIPGGYGKVPIGPTCLEQTADGTYRVMDWQGQIHQYRDDTTAP